MSPCLSADKQGTSHLDRRVEPDEPDMTIRSAADDDVPARRLLAHDLEPIAWDEDDERPLPPPD
jgi:hypothetical protein